MRKASTGMLEQGIQTPSPAPDLIPAEHQSRTYIGIGTTNGGTSPVQINFAQGSFKIVVSSVSQLPPRNTQVLRFAQDDKSARMKRPSHRTQLAADLHVSEKAREPSAPLRAGSFNFAPGKLWGYAAVLRQTINYYRKRAI
jgi:hypothetical protein